MKEGERKGGEGVRFMEKGVKFKLHLQSLKSTYDEAHSDLDT